MRSLCRTARAPTSNFSTSRPESKTCLPKQLRHQGNLREMLDGFHPEKRGEQIRPAGHYAVIGQQNRVVILHQRLERVGKFLRSRRAVLRHRECSPGR